MNKKLKFSETSIAYYIRSSFWAVFFSVAIFHFIQGIPFNLKSLMVITGSSLILGFIFGIYSAKAFDFYISKNFELEAIKDNMNIIFSRRTVIRIISMVFIFAVVYGTLKAIYG